MDKKNTMLLTVIAVATLLVAVVGATFAYFAVSVEQGTAGSTNVTGSTPEQPGTVTFANENANLYLKLSAADMGQGSEKTYYAVTTQDSRGTDATPVNIIKASVSGGPSGVTYTCKGKVNVTLTGEMVEQLEANEAKVVLAGLTGTGLEKDLNDVKSAGSYSIDDATFTVTEGTDLHITALVSLANTAANQTTRLAGKDLTVQIALGEGVTCDTTGDAE